MAILDDINAAREVALKSGDGQTREALTTLVGEITTFAKRDGNREATDKDAVKFLNRFIENAKETADLAAKFNNPAGFAKAKFEYTLYDKFLPAAKPQLSQEALERTVRSIIANRTTGSGVKPKMGVVMNDLKTLHEGEYDAKAASVVVKAELEKTAETS